jgi:hypothetical protein
MIYNETEVDNISASHRKGQMTDKACLFYSQKKEEKKVEKKEEKKEEKLIEKKEEKKIDLEPDKVGNLKINFVELYLWKSLHMTFLIYKVINKYCENCSVT